MAESTKIPKISPSDLQILHHQSNLLHLFHHRNKNQHRRSIWWRHFSLLRKQLTTLLRELETIHETPSTHLERTRKKAADKKLRVTISRRLDFWRDVLVVKWQSAFGQVVADARFAPLGVVLLAALARVCAVVGITRALEQEAQREVERVLEEFGREFDGEFEREAPLLLGVGGGDGGVVEDVGVVVERDGVQSDRGGEHAATVDGEGLRSKGQSTSPPPSLARSVRKKRKRGNAIDDLFSSLD